MIVCTPYREPASLKDAINLLQEKCGIVIPKNDQEWEGVSRMCIDVRREHVLADGLREAKKSRFEPAKLLKVWLLNYSTLQDLFGDFAQERTSLVPFWRGKGLYDNITWPICCASHPCIVFV